MVESIVAHPIWTMIGALAAVVTVVLTSYGYRAIQPPVPDLPDICTFFDDGDITWQKARKAVYEEVSSILSRAPAHGTEDAIHAVFGSHLNLIGSVTPMAQSQRCHQEEVRALAQKLGVLLAEHETNQFTSGARHAIGVGTTNMSSRLQTIAR